MFGPKVIIKYDVTQCDFCLGITHTPSFIKIWLETHCALARMDTVYTYLSNIMMHTWDEFGESGLIHL